MKNRTLLITAIVFFLLVNTGYFWGQLNLLLVLLLILLLVITWFVLAGAMVWQGHKVIEEKFSNIERVITFIIVVAVVVLTLYWPFGIINFKQFEMTLSLRGNVYY